MSDYSELKRLAEHHLSLGQAYTVAKPSVLLALIAENERLRESDQEATELCDTLSVLLGEIAVSVRGPEEPKSRHGFHDLPSRVKTVVAERDQLKAESEALRQIISDSATSCGAAVSVECTLDFMKHLPVEIFSVISKLRNALAECANSLHGEMLQKFGGQLPDDMHPVTRREYDRDMAEVAGYRVALGQGEQS